MATTKETVEPGVVEAVVLPEPPEEDVRRKKTFGEWGVNRALYTGVGLIFNEISSLWITDQWTQGKNLLSRAPAPLKRFGRAFSKEGFTDSSEWVAKRFNISRGNAENKLLMGALFVAGTLLVGPMKLVEDHKNWWVKKLNHLRDKFDEIPPEQAAARDAEVEKAIACEAKQSWPSLMFGRAVAMVSSWSTGAFLMGEKRNKRLMDAGEHAAVNLAESANIAIGGDQNSRLARLAKSDTYRRYARLVPVETYSCTISSVVLEVMSKLFARHRPMVHNPELCAAGAPPAVTSPVDTPPTASGGGPKALKKILTAAPSASHAEQVAMQKDISSQQQPSL